MTGLRNVCRAALWSVRLASALLLGVACGDEAPEQATILTPSYTAEPCRGFDCSDVGECVWRSDAGAPRCECITGYEGVHCESCAADFHRDADWHCIPDQRCDDQPDDLCAGHGDCEEADGVIACKCDRGYRGVRCELCAPDYSRDDSSDECL